MFKTIILVVLLSLPTVAFAQNTNPSEVAPLTEEFVFPTGKPCKVSGVRYQCFTLAEMKELVMLENELRFFSSNYTKLFNKVNLLEEKTYQLEQQNRFYGYQVVLLKTERERLYLKWKNENKLRLEAENTSKTGNALAWGVAGVEGGIILSLLLVLLLGG